MILFNEKICPVCGKAFIKTHQYVYRYRDTYFCSWGCKMKHERVLTNAKKKCIIEEQRDIAKR